jgi:glyoxylase-like metal-dependent hydrolase (beta-lactamase superfamily II)
LRSEIADRDDAVATLALAEAAGVHRIVVPTPFSVGAVNAYVIEDDPLTLIDAGPNSGTSLEALQRGLEALGHRVEDLGLIVVTHQHMDHLGLVDVLAQRSGAEVAALDVLAPWAADWPASMAAEDDYADAVMGRYGVPPELRSLLKATTAVYRGWGASLHVSLPLADGAVLRLRDRELVVYHRPGHSPSDIVLHDEGSGALIVADHLLRDVDANALICRPLSGPVDITRQRSPLSSYAESLRRSRAMEVAFVLPGHGSPFDDHHAVIDARLAAWSRHAERLHGLLGQTPRTAFELAECLWDQVPARRAFHMLSSVLGRLDLLIEHGAVRAVVRDDDVVAFAAPA